MGRTIFLFTLLLLAACAEKRDLPVAELDCRTGLYRSAEGDVLSLTPLSNGKYRWRRPSGETGGVPAEGGASTLGWTGEPDGMQVDLGACGDDAIAVGPQGTLARYERVPLAITETTFERDGLTFAGRLIWPEGAERAPLAVHVHGSERSSALRIGATPYLLAAEGVASFVYDKRGTGRSGGDYTQDFHVLAADARAALAEARRLAGERAMQTGFIGGSQGGWVAPLAASESKVDYVVALYGMAENPLAEDRNEVIGGLARAGWGEAEQAKGAALADAAGGIMASNFRAGFDEFDRLRDLYRDELWYDDVEGEFTGQLLPHPAIGLRLIGPMRDVGTPWDYEPVPVLRKLDARQFWMIAANDSQAPPQETIRRLRALQAEGRPIDLAIYPEVDHGMVRLEPTADGGVREPGYVHDYYRQIAAWIVDGDLEFARSAGAQVHAADDKLL